jgi:arylsulfatase A-like enzyme
MDGVNLVPFLNDLSKKPQRALYWRFWEQAAVREGKWKYLRTGTEAEYLFDMSSERPERTNLLADNPEVVSKLKTNLSQWADTLKRPGLSQNKLRKSEKRWYNYYYNQ